MTTKVNIEGSFSGALLGHKFNPAINKAATLVEIPATIDLDNGLSATVGQSNSGVFRIGFLYQGKEVSSCTRETPGKFTHDDVFDGDAINVGITIEQQGFVPVVDEAQSTAETTATEPTIVGEGTQTGNDEPPAQAVTTEPEPQPVDAEGNLIPTPTE